MDTPFYGAQPGSDDILLEQVVANAALDLALVVDLSFSMRTCIEGLVANLGELLGTVMPAARSDRASIDARVAIVGHQFDRETVAQLWVRDFTSDRGAIEAGVRRLLSLVRRRDEATLHAVDWAIDNLSWRPGNHRKFLAVFTDERVGTGQLLGLDDASAEALLRKLYAVSLFLVAPIAKDASRPLRWGDLCAPSFCKGYQDVRGASPANWREINFAALVSKIGVVATTCVAEFFEDEGIPGDVFGLQSRYRIIELA